jgi:alcohol dehydrogenase
MKAVVWDGKNIEVKDVAKPVPSSTQVLLKILDVGLCGTDLAIVKGHLPTPVPIIIGHEIVGEVIDLGADVDRMWLGKIVTPEINSNVCGKCYYCVRGAPTQCMSRKALGIDIDGGMAEYMVVESYLLHEIPASITPLQGTFIEPLAAAYQTFEMMPVDRDDKVMVIFGLGKLGLLILQVALQDNFLVVAIDGSAKKRELAAKLGAILVIDRHKGKEKILKDIMGFTANVGADIVVDTTGNPDALELVVKACRTRGKIHMKSTHGLATPMNITEIVVREITVYSSRCGPFEKAIEGMKSKAIAVDDLISQTFPLEKIQDAIDSYAKSSDHIKTIIEIGQIDS